MSQFGDKELHGEEALRRLLDDASNRFASHPSEIGQFLAACLRGLGNYQLHGEPATRPACQALRNIPTQSPLDLVGHIKLLSSQFHWRVPGFGKLNPSVSDNLAVVELVGPNGMIDHSQCRFGILLQDQNALYPNHRHAAEELYCVLGGTAHWSVNGQAEEVKQAGEYAHHRPFEPHRIETHASPMLAMWGWSGDITSHSYSA